MATTLQLNFTTAAGKKVMLTIDEPRVGLTAPEVEAAMQEIIISGAFEVDGTPLAKVVSAQIVERNATALITS